MPSRGVDVLVRVVLGVAGLAGMVLVVVLWVSTEDWAAPTRVLATLPPAALFVYGVSVASELRDRYEGRNTLQFRRMGKRSVILGGSAIPVREFPRPSPYANAVPASLAINPRNSLVALAAGALVTFVAWTAALSAAGSPDAEPVWVFALPVGLFVAGRAAVRLVFGGRAVVIDATDLTLGVAVGLAWPLRIPITEIASILVLDENGHPGFLVGTDDDRTYHITGRHLANPQDLVNWLETYCAGSEGQIRHEEHVVAAPLPPMPSTVTEDGPAAPRTERARALLLRRIRIATGVFVASLVAASLVAFWWMNLRAQNNHLDDEGTIFTAEVFRVVDNSRGAPGELHVRFVADGETFERIIYSGWFQEFRRDLKGGTIPVLFDPNQGGIAKLPGQTHYGPLFGMAVLGSVLFVGISRSSMRGNRRLSAALEHANWQRVQISTFRKRNSGLRIRRAGDDDYNVTGPVAGRGRPPAAFADTGAWMASKNLALVVLPDDSDSVLTATVGRRNPLATEPTAAPQ